MSVPAIKALKEEIESITAEVEQSLASQKVEPPSLFANFAKLEEE